MNDEDELEKLCESLEHADACREVLRLRAELAKERTLADTLHSVLEDADVYCDGEHPDCVLEQDDEQGPGKWHHRHECIWPRYERAEAAYRSARKDVEQ